jgi:hypothetical protein
MSEWLRPKDKRRDPSAGPENFEPLQVVHRKQVIVVARLHRTVPLLSGEQRRMRDVVDLTAVVANAPVASRRLKQPASDRLNLR